MKRRQQMEIEIILDVEIDKYNYERISDDISEALQLENVGWDTGTGCSLSSMFDIEEGERIVKFIGKKKKLGKYTFKMKTDILEFRKGAWESVDAV